MQASRGDLHVAKGSCLCGCVTFEISDVPVRMNICHCSMCRKVTGSAYGVFAHIHSTNFAWLGGSDNLIEYESSRDHLRVFCKTCGSSMPNINEDYVCIPAGSFDDDPGIRPELQIFAGSKAPWHSLADEPVSHDEFDPD